MYTFEMPRQARRKVTRKRAPVITGRGAYYKKDRATGEMVRVKKKAIRAKMDSKGQGYSHSPLWGAGGGALASAFGLPPSLGAMAGNGLGSVFKAITGHGDYKQNDGIVNNSLYTADPMMTPVVNPYLGPGDVYRRSEYIMDIVSSSSANTFLNQSIPINPGLESSFEWLSQEAANYAEYEISGMYFEYRSMSADALNSVNTALGQVIMAANYNSTEANFTSKQAMENYSGGISVKPSANCRFFLECAKNQTVIDSLYIRGGAVPSGQDIRLYDLANFQIATNGFQGTSVNCGELWVCYEIVLRKPRLFSALGLNDSFAQYFNTAYTNAQPFGTGTVTYSSSNNLLEFQVVGLNLSFKRPTLPQSYIMTIRWGGTPAAILVPSFTTTGGLSIVSILQAPQNGVLTSTECIVQFIVTFNPNIQPGVTPNIASGTLGTLPAAGSQVAINITQIPNTFTGI